MSEINESGEAFSGARAMEGLENEIRMAMVQVLNEIPSVAEKISFLRGRFLYLKSDKQVKDLIVSGVREVRKVKGISEVVEDKNELEKFLNEEVYPYIEERLTLAEEEIKKLETPLSEGEENLAHDKMTSVILGEAFGRTPAREARSVLKGLDDPDKLLNNSSKEEEIIN